MLRYLTASPLRRPRRALSLAAALVCGLGLVAPVAQAGSSTFYITGGGDGHGIGMSQYGAYGYAQHGKSYRFILSHYYQGTSIGNVNPNWTMRVLLSVGSAAFSGSNYIHSVAPGVNQWKRLYPGKTYSVSVSGTGEMVLYSPSGKKLSTFAPPVRAAGPGPLNLAGHGAYHGAFEFRPSGSSVQTVNAVDLEDYVRGVISAEMPASWSAQALDAQAVAARTYAITSSVGGPGYSLYSDTRSQMYGGVGAETSTSDAAEAATRGQVVTYGGKPVTTYFFASSGGYTEDVQNVWLGATPEPWLKGVSDPYDGAGHDPYHHWTYQLSMSSAAAKLGSLVKGAFVGIRVTKRGVSPRVIDATVLGSKGASTVSGPQLQGIFGLMSTYMSFSTIATAAGAADSPVAADPPAAAAAVFQAQHPAVHALHGRLIPAPAGSAVAVQRLVRGHWRTVVRRLAVSRAGRYSVALVSGGHYRVLYRGLAGPAVAVR